MAFIITSNAIGLSTGEWRVSSGKTLYTIVTVIAVLIVSTVIFGCRT